MSNEQMFNAFAGFLGVSFYAGILLGVLTILFSISNFIFQITPQKKYVSPPLDAETQRQFDDYYANRSSSKKIKNSIPNPVINTVSPIREYRLPDGSKVAFDTGKVEVSEKSVI